VSKDFDELPLAQFTEMDILSGEFPSVLARLAQELGPVFRRRVTDGPYAGLDAVYMVGPEANRFVLHSHREHFSHDKGWTPVIGDLMGRGLLNMDDPEHARHRKLWNPAFTSAYMETYLPLIQQVIAEHTARWVARDEVDLYQEAREITFDVAARALAGIQPGPEVERLQKLFYALIVGDGMRPNQSYEEYWQQALRTRDELTRMLLALIAERRAMPAEERPHDVLGLIVHARDERGEALSDEQVLGHLNILLVAGHETTTVLGAWTLYLLATLPEQRQRVEAELDALLEGSAGPLSVEAARTMKLLDNLIRETGRLHPPVFSVPRGVVQDVEFAGYTLPEGTIVRLALAAGHRLPNVFANPDVFDPDRLAPPREEDKRTPYSLVTFGGGPRLCIGINFANIEVKALAAHVLRSYHLEPVSDEPPIQIGFTATIIPSGIPVRVTPRV
jgi:retinoid hydroxylase